MFSVVIPTKNEEDFLPKLLNSISRQTLLPEEIIVADADSTDRTRQIALNFGCRVVDGGLPGAGRNRGAAKVKSENIVFFDADVELIDPDFFQKSLAEFEQRRLQIATCDILPLSDSFFERFIHRCYNTYVRFLAALHPHAPGFCIFVKRDIHEKIGGFDETVTLCEDHDYALRACRFGRFGVLRSVPIPVSTRRFKRDGYWSVILKYLLAELHIIFLGPIRSDIFRYRFGHHWPKNMLIILSLLFLGLPVIGHASSSVDIGFLNQESISFSEEKLIAGERVRVYARIHNFGDTDVIGRVAFYQGTIPLGSSQIISVRADGTYEEVFVDFTVPESSFNIRAQIVDTEPTDENLDNNLTLSSVVEPIQDDDGDGVENDDDLCPAMSDPEQTDADGDGLGDLCDDDDDNDGLTDEVEEEMGEEELEGSEESEESEESRKSEESEESEESRKSEESEEPEAGEEEMMETTVTETIPESLAILDEVEEVENKEETITEIQKSVMIESRRQDWDTYVFEGSGDFNFDEARFNWDFGDGAVSNKKSPTHKFRQAGRHTVSLTLTDNQEVLTSAQTEITISFFHWSNPTVKLLVSVLLVFLIAGLSILTRFRTLTERHDDDL